MYLFVCCKDYVNRYEPFRFLAFVPTIIVLVVITYLSLAKNPVHSQEFYLFEGADKLVHGCMVFGALFG